jgi:alpha-amylase/alpha-mannosidase (GH57 family)
MVVYFGFLFHIYQPPVQIPAVVKQIVNESYRPIIEALKDHPEAKITLNINATLTEQLHDFQHEDLIAAITTLASKGQIEFTGSGKFHPLLPLIPEPEINRQIELNNETNRHFFGKLYNPRGFFPPEMAVSEEVFKTVKNAGFDWMIMSGIANTLPEFPTNHISVHPNGLKVLFRDDYTSIDCAFDKINNIDAFVSRLYYRHTSEDYYVILAMDGETFGHHVKHAIKEFLIPLFQALPHRDDVKLCTVSEIVDRFPKGFTQVPRDSSWSTMPYDIASDIPFPLWLDPQNEIHIEQHRFFMYALTLIHLADKYRGGMDDEKNRLFDNARNFLDRGIHSCQQWWASKRPWYSPDMILRGLNEVLMASVNAKRSIPEENPDIKEAMELIMEDMLKAQNRIVLSLI